MGRTPISEADEIRPISPVNVIGGIEGDGGLFQKLLGEFRRGRDITIIR
ncbi:MAG: hypothetical protein MUP21_05005 [Dehalococcoidia bacterium]|nr:hypothetical protein [Dehalococcoidia bacterium]